MHAHVCDGGRVVHWVKVRPICNELVSEERGERSQKDCHESGTSIQKIQRYDDNILLALFRMYHIFNHEITYSK